jgi:hypothetical protein
MCFAREHVRRFSSMQGVFNMKLQTTMKSGVTSLAMLAALGLSTIAHAQTLPEPHVRHEGNVTYVTGGVGHDEAQALRRIESHWPLALSFTGPDSEYLADVHVRLVDHAGAIVFYGKSSGPYLLMNVKPGRYTVYARYKDRVEKRPVAVTGHSTDRVAIGFHTL